MNKGWSLVLIMSTLCNNELVGNLKLWYSPVIYSLFTACNSAAVRTSRTNSPNLPHRPKPDANALGHKSWRSAGGPGRDLSTLMELQLNKVFPVYARWS